MGCPICPTTGWFAGWIGSYFFGIHPPQNSGGRLLSGVLTANLISISIIALKSLFNHSLCGGNANSLRGMVRIGGTAFLLGIIYSTGVNYLLNRYLFPSIHPQNQINLTTENPQEPPCCCKNIAQY